MFKYLMRQPEGHLDEMADRSPGSSRGCYNRVNQRTVKGA